MIVVGGRSRGHGNTRVISRTRESRQTSGVHGRGGRDPRGHCGGRVGTGYQTFRAIGRGRVTVRRGRRMGVPPTVVTVVGGNGIEKSVGVTQGLVSGGGDGLVVLVVGLDTQWII